MLNPRIQVLRNWWRTSAATAIVLFIIAICSTLFVLELSRIWSQRLDAIEGAKRDTKNLARSLAQHAEDTFRTADALLISAVERAEAEVLDGPSVDRLRRVFQEETKRLPLLRALSILDRHGILVVNSLPGTARVDFSDREYFQYHREHSDRSIRINKPLRSKILGEWVLPVSRRIDRPDGSFGGVALALINPSYFQSFYDQFDIGKGGAVLLAGTDGKLLVRRPFREENVGKDLSQGSILRELKKAPAGSVEIVALADGVRRLNSYQSGKTYPIVVAVAEETDELLQPWRQRATRQLVYIGLLAAAIATLGLVVWRIARRLDHRNALFKATLESMNQGLMVSSASGSILLYNDRASQMLGLPDDLMKNRPTTSSIIAYQAVNGEFDRLDEEAWSKLQPNGPILPSSYSRIRPDGTVLDIRTMPLGAGGLVRTYTDVTQQQKLANALESSEKQYRLLADNTSDVVAQLNAELRFTYVSPACAEVLGRSQDELIGRHAVEIVFAGDQPSWLESVLKSSSEPALTVRVEYRAVRNDGQLIWIEENRRCLNQEQGFVVSLRDVSKRKSAELSLAEANDRLASLARIDGLTGISNRRVFDEEFDREYRRAVRERSSISIIMIDTDHFKRYNDIYGHPAGDRCLQTIAFTLRSNLRRSCDLVARYGGEEFVVLLPGTTAAGAIEVAQKLREAICDLHIPHTGQPDGRVTVSLGVAAEAPGDVVGEPSKLLAAADKALYRAKKNGRNRVVSAQKLDEEAA